MRSYAASAIGVLGDRSARKVLQKALVKEHSARARVGLLVGLFLLGDKQQLPTLADLLENRSYRVRCAAANTLARLPLSASENRLVVQRLRERLELETTVAARSSLENAIEGLEHKQGKIHRRNIQD